MSHVWHWAPLRNLYIFPHEPVRDESVYISFIRVYRWAPSPPLCRARLSTYSSRLFKSSSDLCSVDASTPTSNTLNGVPNIHWTGKTRVSRPVSRPYSSAVSISSYTGNHLPLSRTFQGHHILGVVPWSYCESQFTDVSSSILQDLTWLYFYSLITQQLLLKG